MPNYDFRCADCGSELERMVEVGTVELDCPRCGGVAPRAFSAPAIGRFPTANQRRRMEDARGIDRDGARTRFREQRRKMREAKKRADGG